MASVVSYNGSCDSSSLNSFKQVEEIIEAEFQFCIIGEHLRSNAILKEAVEVYQVPVLYSETGYEYVKNDSDTSTVFVLQNFEGEIYETLHKAGVRIFGPTAVIQYAVKHEPLPYNARPLYSISMRNVVICFTGFRVKEDLFRMASLIHHMGGSVRKDFNVSRITHLVANSTSGEKYRYAASFGIPIMRMDWIETLWSRRHDIDSSAMDESVCHLKLPPFFGCRLVFLGFKEDEKKHMEEVTVDNGGEVVLPNDTSCTHIVVEDGFAPTAENLPENHSEVLTVKTEWFWASIQMEARAEEKIYTFEPPRTPSSGVPVIVPPSVRGNKRKRLESVAHQLALGSVQETDFCSTPRDNKRKTSDVAKLSISGSFLDATLSPEKTFLDVSTDAGLNDSTIKSPIDLRNQSPRQQVCTELLQTETNYVGILHTILTVFKEPLEKQDQLGGPLIAPAEAKMIFGNLPPIYEAHQKIRTELAELIQCWKEDCNIGNVFLKHSQDLMKAYPPFTNFLEKSKEILQKCDATKPRFHAFLKRCQSKPECGRQSLQELLIRPIQRLPSVSLLLTDILKHTNKNFADYVALEKALAAVKEVLTHMNEDKRRTEGQVAMFDIVNEIENCPPNLLSSHRNFITRADMQEIGDALSRKGDTISMFLFTDVLEICKVRSRAVANLKSPGVVSLTSGTSRMQQKCFKHIMLIPLPHIKRVVDVIDTEDARNLFAIVVRSNQELKERLYCFILLNEEENKAALLRTLCRHMANTVCRTDVENLLTSLEPQHLALDTNDSSGNALTKALKIANKTRDKLGRALSMRRTPTKRGLSRAVSTIISPLRSLGSSPSSTLQASRLASVSNLSILDSISSGMPSPVIGKKTKSSSVGVSSSKYL